MHMERSINDITTINDFVQWYCEKKGFGSMNKNDFEVFIFSRLLLIDRFKGKSNYELSILLHIPESKIKRLRYEAALKHADINTDYAQKVYDLLEHAQLRASDRKIVFQTEDVMIKSYISSILKKEGRLLDSSFNPELIVLHLEDFQYLAEAVYPKGESKRILAKAKKLSKSEDEITWRKVMGWVVEGAVSGTASAVVTNLTPGGIIQTISKVLTNIG